MGIKQYFSAMKQWNRKKVAGAVLAALYPFILVLLIESNQQVSFGVIAELITKKPTILLFDVLAIWMIYGFLVLCVKRVWIAALGTGALFYILSCVEYYRLKDSGSHFTLYDLVNITNMGDVAEFADLTIHPMLIVVFLLLGGYITALCLLKVRLHISWHKWVPFCAGILAFNLVFFTVPAVSDTVFRVFGIDYGGSNNNFVMSDKFENNNFIAFLVENASYIANNASIKEPENYSANSMSTNMGSDANEVVSPMEQEQVTPNVLVIMNESYADFRVFEQLSISDAYYYHFDRFCEEGYAGKAVVPTFGNYTVRTEFELLFGLPIKTLNSTVSPQFMISEEEQVTIPAYYQTLGYHTAYIHPYTTELYGRETLYPYYGFDELLYDDAFEEDDYFRQYIDDGAAFDKALEIIENKDEPAYIHITTMQNHMPYNSNGEEDSQMDYYMTGIGHTDDCLGELMDSLKALDEPTIVLFIGDHFPLFTDDGNVYNQLNINRYNCLGLYEQSYFLWSNYDCDFSNIEHQKVSVFYLPYLIMEAAGLPQNELTELMLEQIDIDAVYTLDFKPYYSNEVLDAITYDLILGDRYAVNQ